MSSIFSRRWLICLWEVESIREKFIAYYRQQSVFYATAASAIMLRQRSWRQAAVLNKLSGSGELKADLEHTSNRSHNQSGDTFMAENELT